MGEEGRVHRGDVQEESFGPQQAFYEVALRKFSQFCDEKRISEVNDQNVHEVLNRFVE